MFISLSTSKGEKVSININKILFFGEKKNNSSCVVLEDGTMLDLEVPYEVLLRQIMPSESK